MLPREIVYFLPACRIGLTQAPKQETMPNQGLDLFPLLDVCLLWRLELACEANARAATLWTRQDWGRFARSLEALAALKTGVRMQIS
ncbi:hypothetical protein [Ensifer sp. OTU672]|uniref:hypothetical protein n=1 Tax=Ensifer sp. OTU672 TaxID=3043861 RepID=UPI00313D03EE